MFYWAPLSSWYTQPYCQLLLVSCTDVDEYKRVIKPSLKYRLERDPDNLLGGWMIVYLTLPRVDPQSKGARKVSTGDMAIPTQPCDAFCALLLRECVLHH